jgi:ceramide glucosyltransferase
VLFYLSIFFAAMAVASAGFFLLSLVGAIAFLCQPPPKLGTALPLSVLKPLKGADPEMYEGFRSLCIQDYPDFEIVFGVSDDQDAAIADVRRLQQEFPQHAIKLIVCDKVIGTNRKASNLAFMTQHAKHDQLVISDSDIRVSQGYLREIAAWFTDESTGTAKVGMVTCMYRAVAGKSMWSKLESLGVSCDFMPGALAARFVERKVRFGLGSTMAVSREALNAIGGFENIADYLADDYELGSRICDAGYRVILPTVVVETFLPEYDFNGFWLHQFRWGRTVRSSRPGGYFGLIITFGLFWALLAFIAAKAAMWSVVLLLAVFWIRIFVVSVIGKMVLNDQQSFWNLWLLPLRDLISPLIWLMTIGGKRIVWRGEEFELEKGKLKRVTS